MLKSIRNCKKPEKVPFESEILTRNFHGGLILGHLTEISGPAGSGKSCIGRVHFFIYNFNITFISIKSFWCHYWHVEGRKIEHCSILEHLPEHARVGSSDQEFRELGKCPWSVVGAKILQLDRNKRIYSQWYGWNGKQIKHKADCNWLTSSFVQSWRFWRSVSIGLSILHVRYCGA